MKTNRYNSVDNMIVALKSKTTILFNLQCMWYKHIWNFAEDAFRWRIKTWWQRSFNGFGFADTWHLYGYLAKVIYGALVYLKTNQCGYPITIAMKDPNDRGGLKKNEENWDKILNEMIYAFKLAKEIGEGTRDHYLPTMPKRYRNNCTFLTRSEDRKMKKGMTLFVKHFFHLWD